MDGRITSQLDSIDDLTSVPRLRLAHLPTPLEPAERLARALGKPPGTLFVKRDDCTGLAAGGNKLRKLEFVVAAAVENGCDWLVTLGGSQSNAARMTAAVARTQGMNCSLILAGEPPEEVSGNLVLDAVLGAHLVWADADDARSDDELIQAECDRLTGAGHRPFAVPVGASIPLGSLGYVGAAFEIRRELPDVDVVVTATGSAGTHAGLVAGFGDHGRVMGVRVGERQQLRERVERLAVETAELAGLSEPVGECWLEEAYLGDGYGAHTAECGDAIVTAARTEGLILDPVYTGKAMAALIGACRSGTLAREAVIVYLHTGGMPGLLSHRHADWAAGHAAEPAPAP